MARQAFPFRPTASIRAGSAKLSYRRAFPKARCRAWTTDCPASRAFTVGLRGSTTWQFVDALTKIVGTAHHEIRRGHSLTAGNNYQREVPSGQFNFAARSDQQSPGHRRVPAARWQRSR